MCQLKSHGVLDLLVVGNPYRLESRRRDSFMSGRSMSSSNCEVSSQFINK